MCGCLVLALVVMIVAALSPLSWPIAALVVVAILFMLSLMGSD